jgi:hypothetical protein
MFTLKDLDFTFDQRAGLIAFNGNPAFGISIKYSNPFVLI